MTYLHMSHLSQNFRFIEHTGAREVEVTGFVYSWNPHFPRAYRRLTGTPVTSVTRDLLGEFTNADHKPQSLAGGTGGPAGPSRESRRAGVAERDVSLFGMILKSETDIENDSQLGFGR